VTSPDDPPPSHDEVWEILGKLRVKAWTCLVPDHRYVFWRGDVAHCRDCDLTSEHTRKYVTLLTEVILRRIADGVDRLYPVAEWPTPNPFDTLAADQAIKDVLGDDRSLEEFTAVAVRSLSDRLRAQVEEIERGRGSGPDGG